MSTLSPELEHGIDVIVGEKSAGLVSKFLARRALKKEIRAVEPLINDEPSFRKLGALSNHLRNDEDPIVELVIRPEFDDTADLLLESIPKEGLPSKKSLGRNAVWDALHAWEATRTDTTRNLATRALNSFYGGSQENLRQAFLNAIESGRSVDEELSDLIDKDSKVA
jgi:hypothetical protein